MKTEAEIQAEIVAHIRASFAAAYPEAQPLPEIGVDDEIYKFLPGEMETFLFCWAIEDVLRYTIPFNTIPSNLTVSRLARAIIDFSKTADGISEALYDFVWDITRKEPDFDRRIVEFLGDKTSRGVLARAIEDEFGLELPVDTTFAPNLTLAGLAEKIAEALK